MCMLYLMSLVSIDFNFCSFQANLPLLQRELLQCAQMAKQTPQQYLHQHEQILHERDGPPLDTDELTPLEVSESGKRKAPSESRERYDTIKLP